MEYNAIINKFRLVDFLNILDARSNISIFTSLAEKPLKDGVYVCELLADKDFIETYGKRYDVKGLVSFIDVTNILIEEA